MNTKRVRVTLRHPIKESNNVQFSLLSAPRDGNKQCHDLTTSRGVISGIIRDSIIGRKIFSHENVKYRIDKDPRVDLRRIRILVHCSNKNSEKLCNRAKTLINDIERSASMNSLTTMFKTTYNNYYIFSGSVVWLRTPELTSLFVLLLTTGKYIKKERYDGCYQALANIASQKNGHGIPLDIYKTYGTYEALLQASMHSSLSNLRRFSKISDSKYCNEYDVVNLCDFSRRHSNIILRNLLLHTIRDNSKKQSTIKGFGSIGVYENHIRNRMSFAFVTKDEDGNNVQSHNFTGCREYLTAYLRSSLNTKLASFSHWDNNKCREIRTDKTRILFYVPGLHSKTAVINKPGIRSLLEHYTKKMFFAKRVVNYYEARYGIRKSKISNVTTAHPNGYKYCWLLIGSSDWLKNPVMLSIYVLLIRAAFNSYSGEAANADITDDMLRKLWQSIKSYGGYDDIAVLSNKYDHVKTVLRNADKLPSGKLTSTYYTNKWNKYNYQCNIGVTSLVTKSYVDTKLCARFKKIFKEEIGGLP